MLAIIASLSMISFVLIDSGRFISRYFNLKEKGVRVSESVSHFTFYNKKLKMRNKTPIFRIEKKDVEPLVSILDVFPYREGQKVEIIYDPNDHNNCIIIDKRSIITMCLMQFTLVILFTLLLIDSLKSYYL